MHAQQRHFDEAHQRRVHHAGFLQRRNVVATAPHLF
jgi:hypothetical protein